MREEPLTTKDVAEGARMRPHVKSDGKGLAPAGQEAEPLFSGQEAQDFRSRWQAIQERFVDEPRPAVEKADSLVAGVLKRLAEAFSDTRSKLEAQWSTGDNASTEDLRLALQRYRALLNRLLDV
jgi:hypothetical protein